MHPWWQKHYDEVAALVVIVVWIWMAITLIGCVTTPSDYRLDTTPDHDGERYIGVVGP